MWGGCRATVPQLMLDHFLLVEQNSSAPADQQGGVGDIVGGELVLSVFLLGMIRKPMYCRLRLLHLPDRGIIVMGHGDGAVWEFYIGPLSAYSGVLPDVRFRLCHPQPSRRPLPPLHPPSSWAPLRLLLYVQLSQCTREQSGHGPLVPLFFRQQLDLMRQQGGKKMRMSPGYSGTVRPSVGSSKLPLPSHPSDPNRRLSCQGTSRSSVAPLSRARPGEASRSVHARWLLWCQGYPTGGQASSLAAVGRGARVMSCSMISADLCLIRAKVLRRFNSSGERCWSKRSCHRYFSVPTAPNQPDNRYRCSTTS
jgi:hypothetical protein